MRTRHPSNVSVAYRKERCIGRVSGEQNALITTAQLAACGVSSAGISRRVRLGRLYRQHRGVYSVGRPDLSAAGHFHAAVLAIGEGAVLSHCAAAALWGFWAGDTAPIEVTVARRVRRRNGIRIYCASELRRDSWGWQNGIRVTLPDQTLLDLAATPRSGTAFARAVHEALVQRRVSQRSLGEVIRAQPGHRGAARLVAEIERGPTPTRSWFEDWAVELLRRQDFPPFETNARVPGLPKWVEVDVLFAAQRVVIEIDGDRFHETPYRRRSDARKQALLEAAGFRVLRLSGDDAALEREPQTVTRIRKALT